MSDAITHRTWPVHEAESRFREVVRAVERDGPQTITKHGEEVAVLIDVAEYRRLTGEKKSFVDHILSFPKMAPPANGGLDVFDEIETERKGRFARDIGLDDE